jgi:hypothetical protein
LYTRAVPEFRIQARYQGSAAARDQNRNGALAAPSPAGPAAGRLLYCRSLQRPPELATIACVALVETAAEKFVALPWRAGAGLAGPSAPRDPTLLRHLYGLHVIREHYDAVEAIILAREIVVADAKAHGINSLPIAPIRSRQRCVPSRRSRQMARLLGPVDIYFKANTVPTR